MQEELGDILGRILARVQVKPDETPYEAPCGLPRWENGPGTVCQGGWHRRIDDTGSAVVGRCPFTVAAEIREHVDAERRRLGARSFDDYDPSRHDDARRALEAVRAVAMSRPVRGSVLLSGGTGLGKTHLLVASHVSLLTAGISSAYVTSGDLRPTFRALQSYDGDRAAEAERRLNELVRVAALHLDDIGDVRGSEAFHADFAVGLKRLLDRRALENPGGVRLVAINCTAQQAREHPDIGDRILSRLVEGADVVRMDGRDQRVVRR